jgi:phage-related protein
MEWEIIYFNSTEKKTVESLPKGLYARFFRTAFSMRENGPNLGMPHTKSMGDGLFEMRLRSVEGIARIFYCSVIDNRIYLLHFIIKKHRRHPRETWTLQNAE